MWGRQTVLDAKARNADLQTGSLQTGGARQRHVTGKVRSLRAATRLAAPATTHGARPVRSATRSPSPLKFCDSEPVCFPLGVTVIYGLSLKGILPNNVDITFYQIHTKYN